MDLNYTIVYFIIAYILYCFIMIYIAIKCCLTPDEDEEEVDYKENGINLSHDHLPQNEEQSMNCLYLHDDDDDDDDILPPYTPEAPKTSMIVFQYGIPFTSPDIVIDIQSLPLPCYTCEYYHREEDYIH